MTPSEVSKISEHLKSNLHDLSQVLQSGLGTQLSEMHYIVHKAWLLLRRKQFQILFSSVSWWAEDIFTHLGQSLYDLPGKTTL